MRGYHRNCTQRGNVEELEEELIDYEIEVIIMY